MKTRYAVVKRNKNAWIGTPTHAVEYQLELECGHDHRTLMGAIRCWKSQENIDLRAFGRIERNGVEVPSVELYEALHPNDHYDDGERLNHRSSGVPFSRR